MKVNKELKEFTRWTPLKRDIDWTRNFINTHWTNRDKGVEFVWVTDNCSWKLTADMKATLTDINFYSYDIPNNLNSFENVARQAKVFHALGYDLYKSENIVMNLDKNTRFIPEIGVVNKNMIIPNATYEDNN